jgi:hypothetical protein
MKTLKFSLFLAVSLLASVHCVAKSNPPVLEALQGVLHDHYLPNNPKIDLIFYGPESEKLAMQLLRVKPFEISFCVFQVDATKKIEIRSPSILLFDSGDHFYGILRNINFRSPGAVWYNHVIHAPTKGKIDLIAKLSERTWQLRIQIS